MPRIRHHHLRWPGENRWHYGGGPGHRCERNRCGLELGFFLLFRIIHFFPIGELSWEGGDLIVPKVRREDLGLGRFRKSLGTGKVFRLGSFLVVSGQPFENCPVSGSVICGKTKYSNMMPMSSLAKYQPNTPFSSKSQMSCSGPRTAPKPIIASANE